MIPPIEKLSNCTLRPFELTDAQPLFEILKDKDASVEGKKLILRELAWMGSDYCIPAVQELQKNAELQEAASYTLERMKGPRKI